MGKKKTPEEIYKFYVSNLRTIDVAIKRIVLTLRDAISRDDKKTIDVFVRLYAFLLGAWIECRLKKLLFEEIGFDDNERKKIIAIESQLSQWKEVIKLAFYKHYVPAKNPPESEAKLDHQTLKNLLPKSEAKHFQELMDLLDDEIDPVMRVRNNLAHGQWAYPLNHRGDEIAQKEMDILQNENILSLQFKKRLVSHIADMIHDLVVSPPTFERDFDKHFKNIEETRRDLKNSSYDSYTQKMRDKYQRGKLRRNSQKQN